MPSHITTSGSSTQIADTRADEPVPTDAVCEAFGEILDGQLQQLTKRFDAFATPASRRDSLKSGR